MAAFICRLLLASGLLFGAISCNRGLPKEVQNDVLAQKENVDKIIALIQGDFKHKAWNLLANFTDQFGPRVSGSQVLEDSIDRVKEFFEEEGIDVHTENVDVPDWIRGEERGSILEPRYQEIAVMSLGGSISTNGAIDAEVIVVRNFEELDKRQSEVPGKIVVYNQEWTGYGSTVAYRHGSVQASKYGAVASLTKSVADFSLYTPHTGQTDYNETIAEKIPTGCITIEDAELLQRYQDRGQKITMNITMITQSNPSKISRNVVAEIKGSEDEDDVVLFGGHIDSWDVGVGAMDDGGGCAISVMVLLIMKELNIKPKRTMRCVLWTAEEEGLIGAEQYYQDHKADIDNFVWMIESDAGIFGPLAGIEFDGSGLARAYMEEIMEVLLAPIGITGVKEGAEHPDLSMWPAEVPKGSLGTDREKYFWYHHTHADTMEVMDPDVMDSASIIWAASTYAVANMDNRLPRDGDYPSVNGASRGINAITTSALAMTMLMLMWF